MTPVLWVLGEGGITRIESIAEAAKNNGREVTPLYTDDVSKNLAMLVRMLCQKVRKSDPDSVLVNNAINYLKREGLEGSPLREEG